MEKSYIDNLSSSQKELLYKAKQAMSHAYNPYSWFYVWAALLTSEGAIITWCNIENAAYWDSICAERVAVVSALKKWIRWVSCMAVIGWYGNETYNEIITPCGSCRQVLSECVHLNKADIKLILSNECMNSILLTSVNELLPISFSPNSLN